MTKTETIQKLKTAYSYVCSNERIAGLKNSFHEEQPKRVQKIEKQKKLCTVLLVFAILALGYGVLSSILHLTGVVKSNGFLSGLLGSWLIPLAVFFPALYLRSKEEAELKRVEKEKDEAWELLKQENTKHDQESKTEKYKAGKAAYEELFPTVKYTTDEIDFMISALLNNEADDLKEAIRILKSQKHMNYVEKNVRQTNINAAAAREAAEEARDNTLWI